MKLRCKLIQLQVLISERRERERRENNFIDDETYNLHNLIAIEHL